jgi:hypothetical protein
MAAWTIAAVVDDFRESAFRGATVELIGGALCIAALIAYFDPRVVAALGRGLSPLAVAAAVTQTLATFEDVRDLARENEDDAFTRLGIAAVGLVFGVPIALGFVRGLEAWWRP